MFLAVFAGLGAAFIDYFYATGGGVGDGVGDGVGVGVGVGDGVGVADGVGVGVGVGDGEKPPESRNPPMTAMTIMITAIPKIHHNILVGFRQK